MFVGTIVNALAVVVGSVIGLSAGKLVPERIGTSVMKALGLCTVYIGVSGMGGGQVLLVIASIIVGVLIGEALRLEERLQDLGRRLEACLCRKEAAGGAVEAGVGAVGATGGAVEAGVGANGAAGGAVGAGVGAVGVTGGVRPAARVPLAQGFVSASILFCVGAMTVMGALEDGLRGNHAILLAKSALDFCSSIILGSTLGAGVTVAALSVLVVQGGIALAAHWLEPFLGQVVVTQMSCVGSVVIAGLGLNIMGVTELKITNYLPAVFLPILLCPLTTLCS